MISKELLREVMGIHIAHCSECKADSDLFYTDTDGGHYINIYELAHKCKEWAKLKELTLFSGVVENSDNEFDLEWSYDCQIFSHKEGIELFYIKCESEPEAIFKACEYILNSIKQ